MRVVQQANILACSNKHEVIKQAVQISEPPSPQPSPARGRGSYEVNTGLVTV